MEFKSRKLKPYSEPVSVDLLQVGEVYFACAFLDEDMLVPILEPLIFIGKNLSVGDVDSVYFQDAESWKDGLRYSAEAAAKGARFRTGSVSGIYTYERALDLLLACSLRRNKIYPGQ
jgi:hypothetical protein